MPTVDLHVRAAAQMRAQLGVLHRRQAIGCGLTGKQVDRYVASGVWVRVHPQVYAASGVPVTFEARCWAAWLAVRYAAKSAGRTRRVVVSGWAAAAMHGMGEGGQVVELTVPLDAAVPRLRGVLVRRVRDWGALGVSRVRGLPVTNRPETIARLAAQRSDDEIIAVAQEELFHRRVTLAGLSRCRRIGRNGSARLGRVVAVLESRADSAMHARGRAILVRAGMPRPNCGRELVPGTGETDCFVERKGATGPPWGYVVEYDGALHRVSRRKYRFGLWKRRTLERGGYPVMRFTDDDITAPADMIAEVLEEDARQRSLPPEGDGLRSTG